VNRFTNWEMHVGLDIRPHRDLDRSELRQRSSGTLRRSSLEDPRPVEATS
jgi:hypothetical protein